MNTSYISHRSECYKDSDVDDSGQTYLYRAFGVHKCIHHIHVLVSILQYLYT